jgi:limonene-1,2-epoxide hydrolase
MASQDPAEVVARFCATWKTGDPDALIAFFADEATYHNVMDEPWHGRDQIRAALASFFTVTPAIDFTLRGIAASGSTVLTERIDICTTAAGVTAHLPIAGVFELRDGLITAWRDYYDTAQFRRLLQLS